MQPNPKLLLTRKLPPAVQTRAMRDYDCVLNADDTPHSAAQIIHRAADCDAIICCPGDAFNANLIAQLPASIQIIASFSVGVDHIDLPAAAAREIKCTNTPDVLSDATAEVAMLCILAAARRAREGLAEVANDSWTGWRPTHLLGKQLTGKRLGIVGMGSVGRATATRARAFGMQIHYHNRKRLQSNEEGDAVFHSALEDLLRVSDVLSLHCPATTQTAGMLNAARIAMLPPGAIVVNTARGTLIDDDALVAALQTGAVFAAGLDVFNGEPSAIHSAYRKLPNVFALPHLGSASEQTRNAMGFRALDNLDAFFAGRTPPDLVAFTPP